MPLPHSDIAPDGGAAAPTAVHVTLCDCEGLGDKDFSADAKLVASLLLTSKVGFFLLFLPAHLSDLADLPPLPPYLSPRW